MSTLATHPYTTPLQHTTYGPTPDRGTRVVAANGSSTPRTSNVARLCSRAAMLPAARAHIPSQLSMASAIPSYAYVPYRHPDTPERAPTVQGADIILADGRCASPPSTGMAPVPASWSAETASQPGFFHWLAGLVSRMLCLQQPPQIAHRPSLPDPPTVCRPVVSEPSSDD